MRILVTGGTGFIGSHTCVALLAAGHETSVIDNLSNSRRDVLDRVEQIAGTRPAFFEGDVRDQALLRQIFAHRPIDAVIHFAGLKAIGESVAQPLRYYDWNIGSTIALCQVMSEAGVKTLVFSSSATVYGDPAALPIREDFLRSTTNPYGASKLMIEDILADLAKADASWKISRLRYFNPVGAHESGLIGETPSGIPNNLMPYVAQVAVGRRPKLSVFGGDYPTPDGTGVRDYIHVVDLAIGHIKALEKIASHSGVYTYNLGSGQGTSVLELVTAFEKVNGVPVPYQVVDRRPGDVATCYANADKALAELHWKTEKTIEDMCRDTWNWQSKNPNGYQ